MTTGNVLLLELLSAQNTNVIQPERQEIIEIKHQHLFKPQNLTKQTLEYKPNLIILKGKWNIIEETEEEMALALCTIVSIDCPSKPTHTQSSELQPWVKAKGWIWPRDLNSALKKELSFTGLFIQGGWVHSDACPQRDNSTWTWPVSVGKGKTTPARANPFPGVHGTLKLEMCDSQDVVLNEQAALPDRIQVSLPHHTLETFSAFQSVHNQQTPFRAPLPSYPAPSGQLCTDPAGVWVTTGIFLYLIYHTV